MKTPESYDSLPGLDVVVSHECASGWDVHLHFFVRLDLVLVSSEKGMAPIRW